MNSKTTRKLPYQIPGIFFVEKSSRQAIVRQLMLMTLIMIGISSPVKSDIVFDGVCGSYSYNLNIPTNKYFGGQCINGLVLVYNDKSTDEIQSIYADPQASTTLDIYDPQNFKVLKTFDYVANDSSIIYVGTYGGLIWVLAGSFIGFTILFFSTYIFIEVAKK